MLFVDVVGFTTYPPADQETILAILKQLVSEEFRDYVQKNDERDRRWILPTGDGMAMLFFGDQAKPPTRGDRGKPPTRKETQAACEREAVAAAQRVQVAFDARALAMQKKRTPKIRIGFHFDDIRSVIDVCERQNYTGPAINIAKRVTDLGNAGHILSTLTQISVHGQSNRQHIGSYIVKHGVVVPVYQWVMRAGEIEPPERRGTVAIKDRKSAYEWGAEIFGSALSTYSMLAFPGDAQRRRNLTLWERRYRTAISAFARRASAGGALEMVRAFYLKDSKIVAEYEAFTSMHPNVRKGRLLQKMTVDILIGLGCPCRGSGRRGETRGKVDRALLTFVDGGSGEKKGLGWGIAIEMPSDDGGGVLADLKEWYMCHVVEDTD